MQASDKIYVAVYPNYDLDGEHLADDWTGHPVQDSENIAYIRKDALLEWANGKMTIEGATEGIVGGYDLALKDLVKHIESL